MGNSSINTCIMPSAGTIHGITSETVLVDNSIKSVRFNPNNEYIEPHKNINEMSNKVKKEKFVGMRESVRENVESSGTEEGFPYGNNIATKNIW